jgi:hypothetical protein
MKAKIKEHLPTIDMTTRPAPSPTTIDQLAQGITIAIRRAIECSTPRKKTCPFSKRWWNEELTGHRSKERSKLSGFIGLNFLNS